jgi:biopolymer transport protein ExbD
MAKISKKGGKETPAVSTASLPDIIFILLFFFMVVVVMREVTLKVENRLPAATEVTKLDEKSLVKYIYIGRPLPEFRREVGTAPKIQLNDAFADVDDIGQFIESERSGMAEDKRSYMKVALKVDRETKIGIVTDVKQELRKANALLINYTTLSRSEVY